MNQEHVKSMIQSGFKNISPASNLRIAYEDGRDDATSANQLFEGKKWTDINPKKLYVGVITFMTPEAFLYYFPVFLLACLEDEEEFTSRIITALSPSEMGGCEGGKFLVLFSNLNREQKDVVICFIDWIIDEINTLDKSLIEIQLNQLLKLRDVWNN